MCVGDAGVILGEKEEDDEERKDYEGRGNEALVLREMAPCPVSTESFLLRAIDGISNTATAA